jgi:hypothetical protein
VAVAALFRAGARGGHSPPLTRIVELNRFAVAGRGTGFGLDNLGWEGDARCVAGTTLVAALVTWTFASAYETGL